MKNSRKKNLKAVLAFALTLAIGVAFMPVNTGVVHAATFSTGGAVSGFKVTAYDEHSVTFGWDSYAGATGYHIFKATSKSGTYTKVGRTLKNKWKRTGLTTNKTCYYKVRAFHTDSNGKVTYSKFSSVIAGTPYGFSTSKAVEGFKVTATSSSSVSFAWSRYPSASGYQIYKASSKSGSYTRVGTVQTNSWKRTGLTTNKTCYYKVRAYHTDSNGKNTYSKCSSVIAGTPYGFSTSKAVEGFKVSSTSSSSVSFAWDEFGFASGYQIYKASSKDGSFAKVGSTQTNSWKRTGLTANKTCYYKVRAYHTDSNGKVTHSQFSSVIAGTPYGFSTSGKPAGFKVASTSYSSIKLTWSEYNYASGYQVYKSTSKDGDYTKIYSTSDRYFKRTQLTTNKTCYYKLRAYRTENGKTKYSQFTGPVAGTPRLTTPEVSVIGKTDRIIISWPAVKGASKYEVYRATSKDGSYTRVKTTTSKSFTNTAITQKKYYYYKVRACRTLNGNNLYSKSSEVRAGVTGPGRVGRVSAVSESSDIKLSWGAVSGASGYQIQRSTDGKNYTVVGTTESTSFKDVNVASKVTYYYRVRAYTKLSGGKSYGAFNKSGYSRSTVVKTAVAWLGCKESNRSNQPIIDIYNKNMGTNFSYTTAWCAMFVSAVAIKSGTTDIIVRGSYCPSVISTYKNSKTSNYSYAGGSRYVPKAGDVIFFDWNRNGVPDHTGLVASVSGNTIKTIEGNYSDAVGYRTFSAGYSMVQGYGLPNYDNANGIVFTGKSKSSVGCGELNALGIGQEPEGYEDLGEEYDFVEQKVEDNIGCDEEISDYEKMAYMVKKVRTNAETDSIDCSETQYYAAFIFELCKEADIEASIMTAEDADGNIHAWIETVLDGNWYTVDASKESNQIERFEHEATDIEE
ncbi:MAG: CHAP domain-containing protein [Clostridia bacterium]|nr:CHAP domain-containing protein [Clostridia bacterium]